MARDTWRQRLLLLVPSLLLLGVMLTRHLAEPLLDRHSWRQADTAGFARGLARGEFGVLHPRFLAYYPDAYGIDGATETEFNLYPLLVAGVFRLFGETVAAARAVSIAFSLGTALCIYLLGRRLLDPVSAGLAVLFLGLSPLYVFYGRTVQPDATALFFSVAALLLFVRWLDTEGWASYLAAGLCTALALLAKIPSLYIGLPMLVAGLSQRGARFLWAPKVWLLAALVLLPGIAYYAQARAIYRATGLTVYGLDGGWPGSGKFDTLSQLQDPQFYRVIFNRLRGIVLGAYGLPLLLLGLLIAPRRRQLSVLYAWLGAVALFVVAAAQGHRQHEYYQLPLVPVAALFVGKACSALLRPGALNVRLVGVGPRLGSLVVGAALLLSFRGAQSQLVPMYAQATALLEVASAVRELTPPDRPVAIIHDWARVPEVFYYADRRGWSLWLERTPEGEYGRLIVAERVRTPAGWRVEERLESDAGRVELLRAQGASAVVVSLEKGTPAEFLRSPLGRDLSARYPMSGNGEHWVAYDLR